MDCWVKREQQRKRWFWTEKSKESLFNPHSKEEREKGADDQTAGPRETGRCSCPMWSLISLSRQWAILIKHPLSFTKFRTNKRQFGTEKVNKPTPPQPPWAMVLDGREDDWERLNLSLKRHIDIFIICYAKWDPAIRLCRSSTWGRKRKCSDACLRN